MTSQHSPTDPKTSRIAAAVIAAIILVAVAVGWWYYHSELEEITRDKYKTLAAIGELKAGQIQQWRKERIAEGKRAGEDSLTLETVKNFLSVPGDPDSHAKLRECVNEEVSKYANILLLDSNTDILFNAENTTRLVPATTQQAIRAALASREAVLSDFFRSSTGVVHIDVAVAVRDREERPLAVLVLRTHATDYLFSLLEFWPTASPTTETVLAQQEGNEVVFINPLRMDHSAPMERRFPLTLTSRPSVQAALGKQGMFMGRDYRNVPVLTDLHAIPGTSWFIISKMDREEILADARYRAAIMGLIVGLLLLLSASVGAYLYRRRQALTFRDLLDAERKHARAVQESRDSHSMILRTVMDGFCLVDLQGGIKEVNESYCLMTGYSARELLAMSIADLEAGETTEQTAAHIQTITSLGEDRFESRQQRKDGSIFDVEVSAQYRPSDGMIVAFLRDITERKATEARLSEALDHAEAGNRAKSEFFAVISHELRTPLNGVLGFAELLASTPLDSEQKSYAETISKSGNHLLAIVNDILDFSSIEKGTLAIHVEPFAFAHLVKSSGQAVQKSAEDKGLVFRTVIEPDVPEQILGDETRIRQILINLLGNAVKFTSGGSVILRVASAKEKGGRLLDFSVEDTGIGMSPETIGILFQPFTQAEMKTNRMFGGTGLGLAISKRLAEAMGGKITVVSAPGKGSTFTLRLPLEISTPSTADPAPAERKPAPPAAAPALVVEDDPNSSTLAGKMLQRLGYRAEFAADGAEAVRSFVPGKFSAILMDMARPVMDGLEATRKIREIEAGAGGHVPIIALTANVMPGDRERCLAAGMDDFLPKPFKRDQLAAMLEKNSRPR